MTTRSVPTGSSRAAISGDWLAVGVRSDAIPGVISGSVYLFVRDTDGNWIEYPTLLRAPDGGASDLFGTSVDMDGDVLVAGGVFATGSVAGSGAAYVWRYDSMADAWMFEQKLFAANGRQSDHFGESVAVEGDTIVVGASGGNANPGVLTQVGAAFVFNYDPVLGVWTERDPIGASDAGGGDFFGTSVALSVGNVWVDAIFANDDPNDPNNLNYNSGAAYTYDLHCRHDPGDFNGDGIVNLEDHLAFVNCMFGPGVRPDPPPPASAFECLNVFDDLGDGDVDLQDFQTFLDRTGN